MKRGLVSIKTAGHSGREAAHAGALGSLDEFAAAAQADPELSHLLDLFRAKLELAAGLALSAAGGSDLISWAPAKAHIYRHCRMGIAKQPYSLTALKVWVRCSRSADIIVHTLRDWIEGPFKHWEACAWLSPADEAIAAEKEDTAVASLSKNQRVQALIAELVLAYETAKDVVAQNAARCAEDDVPEPEGSAGSSSAEGFASSVADVPDTVARWAQTMDWIGSLSWNASQLAEAIPAVRTCFVANKTVGELTGFVEAMIERTAFWHMFLHFRVELLQASVDLWKPRALEYEEHAAFEQQKRGSLASMAFTACQSQGRRAQARFDREAEISRAQEREVWAVGQVALCCGEAGRFEERIGRIRSSVNDMPFQVVRTKLLASSQHEPDSLVAFMEAGTLADTVVFMDAVTAVCDESISRLKQAVFMAVYMAIDIQVTISELAVTPPHMEFVLGQPPCWNALLSSWREALVAADRSSKALVLVEQDEADAAEKKARQAEDKSR
ncbi:hypothetical protein FOA52_011094 [Chlamydomonas sp. UWO 241]|nr:hypothetical protein FOA52_011094 [Chlamydomonas sp. UWO 241]